MGFKATSTLFFVSLAFLHTNGCFNEDVFKEIMILDHNRDGFATYDEVCQTMKVKGVADCRKVFENYDLNRNGKATCQGM